MALRLDSHQHFWRYNETDYGWMDHNILKQDYLPTWTHICAFTGSTALSLCKLAKSTEKLTSCCNYNQKTASSRGSSDGQTLKLMNSL